MESLSNCEIKPKMAPSSPGRFWVQMRVAIGDRPGAATHPHAPPASKDYMYEEQASETREFLN